MTRVCLVGDADVNLQYELLSRETSREALSTYDLRRPFENSIAVRTVSLGSAISLCNDLSWYVVRFVDDVLIQEPSVDETEWLSHNLAKELRSDAIGPEETGEFLKLYGLEYPSDRADGRDDGPSRPHPTGNRDDGDGDSRRRVNDPAAGGGPAGVSTDGDDPSTPDGPPRLVEPLYVRRTDGKIPEYDLRDVSETVVVRLTETEYAP
ncbi:DUF5804 family protein [Halovivax gelatinilyticus]|uniref:DUF5804 family protein n=1 Tax=Halovivax gelatinilyticus TaxID=2961597 RepID=UPI0020CA35DD|nr:DUF5804 family protein [Halovivax gelatinilyticus]